MRRRFRIHGDNVVECERISNLIIRYLSPSKVERSFSSLSCISVDLDFYYEDTSYKWNFELFPGFNKNISDRWKQNILEILKQQGSFLNETPDVIMSRVNSSNEEIIVAIEFCSALQAGNQAWQRSGRAYSTGRTECAYLYIVDFVKYELDTRTRKRKALRFPNAAVPFSYISHSMNSNNFVAQVYFKGEEFQPAFDKSLSRFDMTIFSEDEVAEYIIRKLIGLQTDELEQVILDKNVQMVNFLADKAKTDFNLTPSEWAEIYENKYDIINYSITKNRFKFRKKIAEKSIMGKVKQFNLLVQKYSVGLASVDLPFGIIPMKSRAAFVSELIELYQIDNENLIEKLKVEGNLVVCMLKGFKPGGDDNRPDRGALPLIAMLTGEDTVIMTFIYGPILESNLKTIDQDILKLGKQNGLWKSFVGLSDFIIIDAPVKGKNGKQITRIFSNTHNKKEILERCEIRTTMLVSNVPNQYQENDVDTVIHVLFKYVISNCFEGMCNPPGGDWSGLSIIKDDCEYRWLSLPRVSSDGKRPDHVVEIFRLFDKPLILSIESKEKARDLEPEVGCQLKRYLEYLFNFTPSTERALSGQWEISKNTLNFEDFKCLSVGAYIDTEDIHPDVVFQNSKCDILFRLVPKPENNKWIIKMLTNNNDGEAVIDYIKANFERNNNPFLNTISLS